MTRGTIPCPVPGMYQMINIDPVHGVVNPTGCICRTELFIQASPMNSKLFSERFIQFIAPVYSIKYTLPSHPDHPNLKKSDNKLISFRILLWMTIQPAKFNLNLDSLLSFYYKDVFSSESAHHH